MWFSVNLICSLSCAVLNCAFSLVSIVERHRVFKNSFFVIVIFLSVSIAVDNVGTIVYLFVVALAGVESGAVNMFSALLDLSFSYYSTLLIFFMGLNRFAAFSSPYLKDLLMERKTLLWMLSGLLVFSIVVSVTVYKLSGMERVYDQGDMNDYADHLLLIQVSNYVFYAIPLTSTIFYLLAFNSLRSQRGNAISGATKSLLDKAEKGTLKMGIWILVVYIIALVIHVVMGALSPDGFSYVLLSCLQTLTATAPQIGLPLSVVVCSKDARSAAKHICFMSVKSYLTSAFHLKKSRTSSASSHKTIPLTLEIDTK